MITFKQYLTEAVVKKWQTDNISMQDAIDLLNTHCKSGLMSVANGGLLFRGFNGSAVHGKKYMLVDSSTGIRTSRDTNNAYQLMMDTSAEMTAFPSRSKSFICTTSLRRAHVFADSDPDGTMVMIPFDGTTLGVCAGGDMFAKRVGSIGSNYLFRGNVEELSKKMANFLTSFAGSPNYLKKGAKITDVALCNQFLSKCDSAELEKNLANHGFKNAKTLTREIMKYPKDKRFNAMSDIIITPTTLKVKTATIGSPLPRDREVWFSGKAIMINIVEFNKILKTMQAQGIPVSASIKSQMAYLLK